MNNALKSSAAAIVLAFAAANDANAVPYRFEATGRITSEIDSANIVDSSVLGVGSGFSYSFIFDPSVPAAGGIPGVIEGFDGHSWNFTMGLITGTANQGTLTVANDFLNDNAAFSVNSINPGTTITATGLSGTAQVNAFQSIFGASSDIWGTTSLDSLINGDLALTDSRFHTFRIVDSFNNSAIFDGQIESFRATPVTAVPEPGATAVLFGLGGLAVVGYDLYRRRKESSAKPAEPAAPGR